MQSFDEACCLADMKPFCITSSAGTDDVEWCFSQVKGTVEEEVTEGRHEFSLIELVKLTLQIK